MGLKEIKYGAVLDFSMEQIQRRISLTLLLAIIGFIRLKYIYCHKDFVCTCKLRFKYRIVRPNCIIYTNKLYTSPGIESG